MSMLNFVFDTCDMVSLRFLWNGRPAGGRRAGNESNRDPGDVDARPGTRALCFGEATYACERATRAHAAVERAVARSARLCLRNPERRPRRTLA